MCHEMKNVISKVLDVFEEMDVPEHSEKPVATTDNKNPTTQIKKLVDYLELFANVNEELIEGDTDKKKRKKRTKRYPISDTFLEVTKIMRSLLTTFKQLKIVSITETQELDKPLKLRSVYEHFYDLDRHE